MKKIVILIYLVCTMPLLAVAQIAEDQGHAAATDKRQGQIAPPAADSLIDMGMGAECSLPVESMAQPYSRRTYSGMEMQPNDSIHLPVLNMRGQVPSLMSYPYDTWWGMDAWQLHRGLNVNLGASVFASFGKGAPKGGGLCAGTVGDVCHAAQRKALARRGRVDEQCQLGARQIYGCRT